MSQNKKINLEDLMGLKIDEKKELSLKNPLKKLKN